MSDKEDKSTKATPQPSKPGSRTASPTPHSATSLAVPTVLPAEAPPPTVEKRVTRASSPVGLSAELAFKARSHISRVETLRKIMDKMPEMLDETSPEEVSTISDQVDEIHKAFLKEYAYMERTAVALHDVAATLRDVNTSPLALASLEELCRCTLVYRLSQSLDKSTREAWETSIGSSSEFSTPTQFEAFLTVKARALERAEPLTTAPTTTAAPKPKPAGQRPALEAQAATVARSISHAYPCDCCQADHFLISCNQSRAMTVPERRQLIDKLSLCRNCCGRHVTANCKSVHRCKTCGRNHHSLLHLNTTQPKPTASTATQVEATTSSSTQSHTTANTNDQRSSSLATQAELTLLATAHAQVITSSTIYNARLLVDSGSELSFVSEDLVEQLGLQRIQSSISITGISGKKSTQTRGFVSLHLQSLYNTSSVLIQTHILRTLITTLPSSEAPKEDWPHLNRLKLADPDFHKSRSIDIIIGADNYGRIIKPNLVKGSPSMPVAQLSIFGWLVIGPASTHQDHAYASFNASISQDSDAALRELLTKFWVQEELPTETTSELTPDAQECENHFLATHGRDAAGRYVVRIPLKSNTKALGNSYKYEDLGHMKKASSISPNDTSIDYLPPHGVFKPDSETTKLRVVFNGSSPTTTGISVNDIMHTGANLLLNINDVLLWIRLHKCIFATDVTKMYRKVRVHEDDWNLQRILWIDEESNEVPYTLTTVTYGTKAAPFLAVRALLQLAEDEGQRYPLAVPSIKYARYVDDIFGGADSLVSLIEIASQLTDLCNAGGFSLAKWHSNEAALLEAIVPCNNPQGTSISLDDCNTKILGLRWNTVNDSITFTTKSHHNLNFTKRLVLSEVAQIFDPLGFLSPVIIRVKIAIREDLTSLARLSIPRWFNTHNNSTVELHGFSDASQLAMAAVIYITVFSSSTDLKVMSLVCSKTKVAPLKKLTIPRLELTAALILAKLLKFVTKLRKSTPSTTSISNSPADLERAKIFWIKATQLAYFANELKMMVNNQTLPSSHVFSRLTAFIDDQGVIRVGGRLCIAPLTYQDTALKSMVVEGTQDNQRLAKLFVNDQTTWNFNPPAAPHMGGKWEAVVKSVKYHLRRTVSDTLLTYEEYTTPLNQIEATLNSRPLEPLTDDPDDLSVLTPAHFLNGRPISTLPEPSVEQAQLSPRARWYLIQQKLQQFWKRWSSQHLQRMQSISKWHHPSNNINVGCLVLLTDERFPPCKCPLA
ncbi:uncharacterized protein LOC114881846 [Osmia bicornis bicornis]|uniref:uncharacterized protein LOC114881846 n=1 Tax=Osmia bicornis bicornis TaxID=1437191 RepID=UPI001EAE8CDF|nr:uncharacterized protein LOC114881846 [Osmia bicornis bicornis]